MSEEASAPVKRTTRTRKTASTPSALSDAPSVEIKFLGALEELFNGLIGKINEAKSEFVALQNQIEEVRLSWTREKKVHELEITQRNQQEDVARKREQEEYDYQNKKTRKQDEDGFLEKKEKWEKELFARKEEIQQDKKELDSLRKQVSGFEEEVEKAIKEARSLIAKELNEQFHHEKVLREQEVKAEKELLTFRITNLTQENSRLSGETTSLKNSLDEATRQLKDVAVKVIESANPVKQFSSE